MLCDQAMVAAGAQDAQAQAREAMSFWGPYFLGVGSGIVFVAVVVYGLGLYVKAHQADMMRWFVRKSIQGQKPKNKIPPQEQKTSL